MNRMVALNDLDDHQSKQHCYQQQGLGPLGLTTVMNNVVMATLACNLGSVTENGVSFTPHPPEKLAGLPHLLVKQEVFTDPLDFWPNPSLTSLFLPHWRRGP